jgi:hypothetical protein
MRTRAVRSSCFEVRKRNTWARRVSFLAVLAFLPFSFGFSEGQHSGPSSPSSPSHPVTVSPVHPSAAVGTSIQQGVNGIDLTGLPLNDMGGVDIKQLNSLNRQRKKDMTKDSEKLIALATELNAEMETGTNGTLPSSSIHKAEKIEKLARKVQEKMKGSAQIIRGE